MNEWILLLLNPLFSYRFMDMFPDTLIIRDIQRELDDIIHQGVDNITKLIRATEIRSANGVSSLPDDEITRKKRLGKSAGTGFFISLDFKSIQSSCHTGPNLTALLTA